MTDNFFEEDTQEEQQFFINDGASERPVPENSLSISEASVSAAYINNDYRLDENTQVEKQTIQSDLELFGYSQGLELAKQKVKLSEREAIETGINTILPVDEKPEETLKGGADLLQRNEILSTKERLVSSATEQLAVDSYLKKSLQGTPEQANRALQVAKNITGFLDTSLAIREAEEKLTAYSQGIDTMEFVGDIGLSVLIPFMESTGLGDVAKTLNKEDFSKAGYVLPSQALETIRQGFRKASPEEQKEFVKQLYDLAVDRKQVFGLADNRTVNHAIASIALDAIKEGTDINSPKFMGLRAPKIGDIGYDILSAIDVVGAVDLAKMGKGLINYVFGASRTGVKADPLSNIQNRGALFDGLNEADNEVLGRVVNETPDLVDTANDLGVRIDDISARATPSPTGKVQDVSTAPFVTDAAIDDVYEAISTANPLNLVYPEERTKVVTDAVRQLTQYDEGKIWTGHITFTPPTTVDSLGSWSVRYGADGKKGFDTLEDANVVSSQLKAEGESAKVVERKGEFFVDINYNHQLSGKDVGNFSSVTGERLTTGDTKFVPYLLPPSRRFKGEVKKVQQAVSRAQDTSAVVEKRLLEAADPFLSLGRKDLEDASTALQKGSSERIEYSAEELKAIVPGISDKAIEGYFSARKTYKAVFDIRNPRYRKKLKAQGAKQIVLNNDSLPNEFFGTVLSKKPSITTAIPDDITKSNDLFGNRVWDIREGRVVSISEEEINALYEGTGRLVRLASNYTDEVTEETVRHMVIRGWDDVSIKELPNRVLNQIPGYIEKSYEDVGWLLVQKNTKHRINGLDTIIPRRAIGGYELPFQANQRLAQLKKSSPDVEYEVIPSRELSGLLDESGQGVGTSPTWLRRRGDKSLEGPIDANGLPTSAATLDPVEAIVRSVRNTSKTYLQETEEVLRSRFYNQFGQFSTDKQFAFSEFTPQMLSPDLIRKAGLKPRDVQLDAENLHNYINNIRDVGGSFQDSVIRTYLAESARALGSSPGIVSGAASKALLKGATSQSAISRLRSLTSTLNIAWGVAFQSIQNVITPLTLIAASGGKEGFKSMSKSFELANALVMRKSPDWESVRRQLAKSLEVSEANAEKMVDFARNSGILGTARTVDNLLRNINDVKRVNSGQNAISYYIGRGFRIPSYITEMFSAAVSKSIDIGSLMYYTHSFRELSKTSKSVGSKDFFEEVRNRTRDLGQNQNSSDRFSYENVSNPLSFALQFIQHIHRLGVQGVEVLDKGVRGTANHSPFANSQPAAVKTILAYSVLTGASGFGGDKAAAYIYNILPVDWPDELKQLAVGGLLDVAVSSVGPGNITLSSDTTPGAAGEFAWSALEATYQALVNGVDPGFIDTVFGASTSTMSNMSAAAKFLSIDMRRPDMDSVDKAVRAASIIAETTKLGRDALKAKTMLKFEANLTSTKLDARGRATALEAMAKVFGLGNYTEVLANQASVDSFYSNNEFKNTVDMLTKSLMREYLESTSYTEYLSRMREITTSYGQIYGQDEIRKATTMTLNRIKNFLDEDKGLSSKLSKDLKSFDISNRIETLEQYARIPGISEESRQRARELSEILKNPQKQTTEEP